MSLQEREIFEVEFELDKKVLIDESLTRTQATIILNHHHLYHQLGSRTVTVVDHATARFWQLFTVMMGGFAMFLEPVKSEDLHGLRAVLCTLEPPESHACVHVWRSCSASLLVPDA
jgi:hypothetical protein